MQKKQLEKYVDDGLSVNQIAKKVGLSYTTVRYWLNKFCLQTQYKKRKLGPKFCMLCGKQTVGQRKYCPGCYTKIRRYRAKSAAVHFLGGKCKRCGWNDNIVALEFHHMESGDKEHQLSLIMNKSWDFVKQELKKCELLCSNCHRIEHSNSDNPIFWKAVNEYQGNLLKW